MKWKWITPILFDLPVSYHVVFELLLSVFKSLNNLPPSYLADRLSYQRSSMNLWSASQQLLEKTSKTYETYRDKAFSLCAPKLWNVLPLAIDLHKTPSLASLNKGLKSYLFTQFLESKSILCKRSLISAHHIAILLLLILTSTKMNRQYSHS